METKEFYLKNCISEEFDSINLIHLSGNSAILVNNNYYPITYVGEEFAEDNLVKAKGIITYNEKKIDKSSLKLLQEANSNNIYFKIGKSGDKVDNEDIYYFSNFLIKEN